MFYSTCVYFLLECKEMFNVTAPSYIKHPQRPQFLKRVLNFFAFQTVENWPGGC